MRTELLVNAAHAVNIIIENLYGSDYACASGSNAVKNLEDYSVDLAVDIFEAFARDFISNEEKHYLIDEFAN